MLRERIQNDLDALGFEVFDCPLQGHDAISSPDGYIAVKPELTDAERTTALGHEYGHCATGAYYYLSSPYEVKGKAEVRAERAAVLRYIPHEELCEMLQKGRFLWEIAEHYGVTEQMIERTYQLYKNVLGFSFAGE